MKSVIAAAANHAVAGGFELASWCDLRVVEDDAVVRVFNRRWGIPLIDVSRPVPWRIEERDGRARPTMAPHRARLPS